MNHCPECSVPNNACETHFHECLALEFENPLYGSVHHLTVVAYMLQHSSQLTRDGWLHERALLSAFLRENRTPAEIRKRDAPNVDSGKRDFKIESRDGLPVIAKMTWAKTILDVRLNDPETYCEDVHAWAKAVLDGVEEIEI